MSFFSCNKARKQWKQESGYHRRSLSETAIFRLKIISGAKLIGDR
ncbi:hypothetical protein [Tolypothrix tenuis]